MKRINLLSALVALSAVVAFCSSTNAKEPNASDPVFNELVRFVQSSSAKAASDASAASGLKKASSSEKYAQSVIPGSVYDSYPPVDYSYPPQYHPSDYSVNSVIRRTQRDRPSYGPFFPPCGPEPVPPYTLFPYRCRRSNSNSCSGSCGAPSGCSSCGAPSGCPSCGAPSGCSSCGAPSGCPSCGAPCAAPSCDPCFDPCRSKQKRCRALGQSFL